MRDAAGVGNALRGSAFVGRVAELAVVDALLASVRAGRPSTLVVAGEAGIGKSRLVGELRSRAASAGALIATGRTPVEGVGLPYGTLVGLVRDLRRQLGPDEAGRLDPVQHLLLGEVAERGQLARLALFEHALEAVEGLAASRPLVLVLEDVHWADAGSVDLLDHLVRNLEDRPVLVVATYRPDELESRAPLRKVVLEVRRLPSTTAIDLRGLTRDEVGALVADATGRSQSWAVVDAVHRRSDGNPLFAEELIEVRDRDALPPALRDLLTVRVDRLPPPSRRVIGAASVLGASLDHRLLAEIADLDAADLDVAIADAVRDGVLVLEGPPATIRFRHILLQEVAHDALLPGERIRLHRRAAEVVAADAAIHGDGAGNVAAQLAEHLYEAGDWAGACGASITAAKAGLALYSMHAAHAQLQRAVDAHTRAAGSCRHPDVDDAELLRMAAEAAYLVGELELAADLAAKAVDELPADAEPARVAGLAVLHARTAFFVHPAVAFDVLAAAEERLRDIDDLATLAEVVCTRGRLLMGAGRSRESIEWSTRALDLARRSGNRHVEGHALATIAPSLAELGRVDDALAAGEASIVVAEAVGEPDLLLRAYTNLTDVQFQSGRLADAAELAICAMRDTSPIGTMRLGGTGVNGSEVLIALGRWDEAEALAVMMVGKSSAACVGDALNLALLALRRGDLDHAEREALRDTGTGAQSQSRQQTIVAEIALERGQPEDALEAVDRALAALAGSDFGIELLTAHAIGLQALADVAARPTRGRRAGGDEATKAMRAAEVALAEVDAKVSAATPIGGTPTPWFVALRSQCHAEAARLGPSDAGPWVEAVSAWRSLDDPFHAAYCRYREAEARLGQGHRRDATEALTDAWRSARELGAGTLIARCERLAERARIQLEDPHGPDSSPRQRAAADLGLTAREAEVLDLLARDRTDGQIADELFISKKTASVHVSNILRKLDARDRWHAGEMGRSAALGQ